MPHKSPNGTTLICFAAYTCIVHMMQNDLNTAIFTISINTTNLLLNFKYEQ